MSRKRNHNESTSYGSVVVCLVQHAGRGRWLAGLYHPGQNSMPGDGDPILFLGPAYLDVTAAAADLYTPVSRCHHNDDGQGLAALLWGLLQFHCLHPGQRDLCVDKS